MSELHCRLLERQAELEALEPDWWQLWRRLPAGSPFQSPAWLLSWWRAFHPGRLLTVAAFHEGLLVGLAPLYLEQHESGARLLPLGISLSDTFDFLVDPRLEGQVLAAFGGALGRARHAWTELCIPELPPDAVAAGLRPDFATTTVSSASACPALEIAGESGLSRIPASQRRKLQMARHRVAREAGRLIDKSELSADEWWHSLRRLHTSRWTSRGEAGVLSDETASHFHRTALAALQAQRLTRMYGLLIRGNIVGVYYGFLHRETAYAYLGGFDPDAAYFSPGTVLIGHAISQASLEGARRLDFLRGREPYKYRWGAIDQLNTCLHLTQPQQQAA